jgi:hypothetical protein
MTTSYKISHTAIIKNYAVKKFNLDFNIDNIPKIMGVVGKQPVNDKSAETDLNRIDASLQGEPQG